MVHSGIIHKITALDLNAKFFSRWLKARFRQK